MRAAAAKISREGLSNPFAPGRGVVLQQSFGGHQNARQAIAALTGLQLIESIDQHPPDLGVRQALRRLNILVLDSP